MSEREIKMVPSKNSDDYRSGIDHKVAQGTINWYHLQKTVTDILLAPFLLESKSLTEARLSRELQPISSSICILLLGTPAMCATLHSV